MSQGVVVYLQIIILRRNIMLNPLQAGVLISMPCIDRFAMVSLDCSV